MESDLTEKNYYSREMNQIYWSVSGYKSFLRCQAAAMAELRGEYKPETTKAMLVGSFVDNWMDGTLAEFIEEHPEVFTNKQLLRAEFRKANDIIKRIQENEKFLKFLSGEHQKIMTFKFCGVLWKMKMDSYYPETCIVDLKVVAKLCNLPLFRYDTQGALYQYGVEYVTKQKLPFYIAAVTKEKVPDLGIFQIPQSMLDMARQEIGENMPHLIEVKAGLIAPKRCEKCPYCRATREIKVRDYRELLEVQN